MDGWETAEGGGGRRERTGGYPVCRGGCNRSIAEAEVVAEEGNRRNGLRFPGLSTMESGAQLRRCANPPGPGRVTVKDWSHLGLDLHAVQAKPGRRRNRPTYREHQQLLAQCCSRQRHRRINPKPRGTSPAMSITDRDSGRRGRRGLSCAIHENTRRHPVVSSKGGGTVGGSQLSCPNGRISSRAGAWKGKGT